MSNVNDKLHDIVETVRKAVPGPKEVVKDIAHEMEHAAEFLDPRQSDIRYVGPEGGVEENVEVPDTHEHERRPHGSEKPPENPHPLHL